MATVTTDSELLGPMIDIRSPTSITNPDVNNLIYWIDSYLIQFSRCQSSTRRETTAADRSRIHDFINEVRKRVEHFHNIPELDRPKYHPEDIPVKPGPKLNRVENADVQHILDTLVALRIQMAFCDSAERASGLSTYDYERNVAELDKLDVFMNEILDEKSEHDLPDADLQEPTAQEAIRTNY